MVHAVVTTEYSRPPKIAIIEVPSREPGPGEVTLRVEAVSLNPYDLKQASGENNSDPGKLPLRMASEAAGVVVAIGPDPIGMDGDALAVGDTVFGQGLPGAAADELTVKAANLLHRPADSDPGEAAGLLLVGSTAAHAIEAVGVKQGDIVLIHGASGGVGSLAAQLAIERGATVIGTASPAHFDRLTGYGVRPVVYGDGLADRVRAIAPEGVDAAIDTVGTQEALAVSLELLHDPHQLVSIANFRDVPPAGGQIIGGGPGADPGTEIRKAARPVLAKLFAAGKLQVPVAMRLPLAEAQQAYDLLASGHAGGKVILLP